MDCPAAAKLTFARRRFDNPDDNTTPMDRLHVLDRLIVFSQTGNNLTDPKI